MTDDVTQDTPTPSAPAECGAVHEASSEWVCDLPAGHEGRHISHHPTSGGALHWHDTASAAAFIASFKPALTITPEPPRE